MVTPTREEALAIIGLSGLWRRRRKDLKQFKWHNFQTLGTFYDPGHPVGTVRHGVTLTDLRPIQFPDSARVESAGVYCHPFIVELVP
jgi:hypothetical protein